MFCVLVFLFHRKQLENCKQPAKCALLEVTESREEYRVNTLFYDRNLHEGNQSEVMVI